ncbi:MAG: glycosyltransferase [Methylophilaceae bacterium]|uniref:glycosyltransferase n=1 Tax=Methylicorpusculum sp. TaxID=2713644 RepID=UPI00273137F1|nr:glycosyltransferase [Methylicorpusculum sp.]MDP2178386.1 glycosyltransferase [Methylicorpusculum sp.]MDP3530780.1 glycosyltransferase [Methylicorpusculum sp.]MDZ4099318.1 glycosyltransferase [Methylophilaceae bacterium]
MRALVQKLGYELDLVDNIWINPNYKGITYSDGDDVEKRIASIIKQALDVSVLSPELRQYCTDWPSLYHLSSTRANIMRPFKHILNTSDVLEIGAGCGAITRYIGECGANVLALEGSPRRATIARTRTRDLEKVVVLAEKFDQFQCDHQFDVITLIGVLEYANLFTSGENPPLEMLKRVRSLLKPEGKLIIAIENQLGLKYFAGAPEDHLGQPMYGIEGRYQADQPQTFGRKVLANLLQDAGFSTSEFLAPFPDYKLPVSILTERGVNHPAFDAAALAWQSVGRDPQLPVHPSFTLELAWPEIFKNGLAMDMANSFLVIASPFKGRMTESAELGYHYSTERRPHFCKEACFIENESGDLCVTYHRLAPMDCYQDAHHNQAISFHIPESAPYISGKQLSHQFLEIVNSPGWTPESIENFSKKYLEAITVLAKCKGVDFFEPLCEVRLPGDLFDLLPQNIIETNGHGFAPFDCEWVSDESISVDFIFFRGLFVSLGSITNCAEPKDSRWLEWKFLIQRAAASCGMRISDELYAEFLVREIKFREAVTGMPAGTPEVLQAYRLTTTLIDATALSAERDAALSQRDVALSQRDAAVAERDSAVAEHNAVTALITTIKNSASWRLTRPLRFVARLVRYGLTNQDRQRLTQALRRRYHSLPLPAPAKSMARFAYHRVYRKVVRSLSHSALRVSQLHAPAIGPLAQQHDKPDYVVWGVIDWHFRHQRPQQLALALAATGRRVFYISEALVDDERAGFEAEALGASGQLFQVNLFAKGAPSIYSDAPCLETVAQLRRSIGEVLDWADCKQIVSLVDHPFWYDMASVLPNSRLVYDCMDHHEGFGNNPESLMQLEKQLLSEAELTITTSTWLDDAITLHAKHRALIRNAGEYEHFAKMPDSINRDPQGRRIIGYYGAIAEWFDLDLVESVARQHPNCSVLLVGADTVNARSRLAKLHNVTFTGEVPYSELPHYLHGFDVCLLPFKVIPLTLATNPVKAYEYLGAGKPIVTVDLPEMAQFDGLVYTAAGIDAFLAAVSKVLSEPEPDSLVQQRKAFAEGQSWQHRAEALIQHAESAARDPKVSVIVVTFNNIDLTRACLESLDEYSQYEQLEIIVVDNASSDGSPAFLSEWVANGHNRRLVLNDDNRGFAAANNQGLAAATGEYLVMLNNDTYVTPGWIRTLVRHLQRDRTIGLIGPVTNNIGNEAKIDIAYEGMGEMLLKSSAYTRRHLGQTNPLRTAAFFCVMMPRTTYERVGTLDEAFGRGFFEDDDYCRRIEQLGLRVVCAEDVFIHHQLSASFDQLRQQDRQKLFEENKKIYEAKWGPWASHEYR